MSNRVREPTLAEKVLPRTAVDHEGKVTTRAKGVLSAVGGGIGIAAIITASYQIYDRTLDHLEYMCLAENAEYRRFIDSTYGEGASDELLLYGSRSPGDRFGHEN